MTATASRCKIWVVLLLSGFIRCSYGEVPSPSVIAQAVSAVTGNDIFSEAASQRAFVVVSSIASCSGTTSDANCQQGKQPPVSSYPANIAGKAAYTAALSSAAAGAVACAMATCTATEIRSAAVAANAVNTLTVTTAGNAQAAYPEAARAASSAATAATSVAAIATVASYLNGKDPAKLQLAGQLVVAAEQHAGTAREKAAAPAASPLTPTAASLIAATRKISRSCASLPAQLPQLQGGSKVPCPGSPSSAQPPVGGPPPAEGNSVRASDFSSTKFAQVAPDARSLLLNGERFYIAGANIYWLLDQSFGNRDRSKATQALDEAKAAGLTVIRTWFYQDDPTNAVKLQYAPGQFNEVGLETLDWIVSEASKRGLYLVPVLSNYRCDYGGLWQYRTWSKELQNMNTEEAMRQDAFYGDQLARQLWLTMAAQILLRVNSITGVAYRNDPTILGWSPVNEPHIVVKKGVGADVKAQALEDWLSEATGALKAIDTNHLVILDSEGDFGMSTPDLVPLNSIPNGPGPLEDGVDWAAIASLPTVDVHAIHLFRPGILVDPIDSTTQCNAIYKSIDYATDAEFTQYTQRSLDCHLIVAETIGKPLILGEFGDQNSTSYRVEFFNQVYSRIEAYAAAGRAFSGDMFWNAASTSYPDFDHTTIYLDPNSTTVATASGGTSMLNSFNRQVALRVRSHAATLANFKGRC